MNSSAPLLFLSDISWHSLYQRPQHLAVGLASRSPVLWIEPATLGHPVHWSPYAVSDSLHLLSVPLWPLNARNVAVRSLARLSSTIPLNRSLLESVQAVLLHRALARLGHGGTHHVFVVQNFQLVGLTAAVTPAFVLFDYIDDAFGFTEFPGYVRELWERTIRLSDAVTVTASTLRDQIRAVRDVPVHLVPNGVDFERFATPALRPADLPGDGRPIAGYVGSIYSWFDFDLLVAAAEALPGVHFVLVGPEHPSVRTHTATLRRHPRIHLLGRKPYEQIPSYMQHFSVGIIPFLRNRLTESVNPVKLYEYCAAGIPTVTTLFSDALLELRGTVSIATTRETFVAALAACLQAKTEPARFRSFARENDWANRTRTIRELIDSPSSSQ